MAVFLLAIDGSVDCSSRLQVPPLVCKPQFFGVIKVRRNQHDHTVRVYEAARVTSMTDNIPTSKRCEPRSREELCASYFPVKNSISAFWPRVVCCVPYPTREPWCPLYTTHCNIIKSHRIGRASDESAALEDRAARQSSLTAYGSTLEPVHGPISRTVLPSRASRGRSALSVGPIAPSSNKRSNRRQI